MLSGEEVQIISGSLETFSKMPLTGAQSQRKEPREIFQEWAMANPD